MGSEVHVSIFAAVGLAPSDGDGTNDLGIGGGLISNGDIQFQVPFIEDASGAKGALDSREFMLQLGDFISEGVTGTGGAPISLGDAFYVLNVGPESGRALLLGLGIFDLSANRRP